MILIEKRNSVIFILIIASLMTLIIFRRESIVERITLNRLANFATYQIKNQHNFKLPTVDLQPSTVTHLCRFYWIKGLIFHNSGDSALRNKNWSEAVKCDPNIVILMHALFPEDPDIAHLAYNAQPKSAEALFWLGDLEPKNKSNYYQKGLELNPEDGLRWLHLGLVLRNDEQFEAAMEAFYQACMHGDPGANGCLYAGDIAERLGDSETAIHYYRLSKNEGTLKKADELENKLQKKNP